MRSHWLSWKVTRSQHPQGVSRTSFPPTDFRMQRQRMTLFTTTWKRPSRSYQTTPTDCRTCSNYKLMQTCSEQNICVNFCFSKIREELGMKPLPRDKFSSLSSPSTRELKRSMKKVAPLSVSLPSLCSFPALYFFGLWNHTKLR